MALTVIAVLVILGLLCLIGSIWGRIQLWVPILFLYIIELLRILPLGR